MSTRYYESNEAINHPDNDGFYYNSYAEKIKETIKNSATTDEPLIFGIYGKWGEGKSSLMNLIFRHLEINKGDNQKGIIKFKFNAWRYSTEDKVLIEFFNGLIKVLNQDYCKNETKKVRNKIEKYSKALLSSVTLEVETGINIFYKAKVKAKYSPKDTIKYLGDKFESIEKLKEDIDKELEKFEYRIVVFIDDIDRLKKNEISNIFRLVKLTAFFKNITFILAFDDDIVAKAIYKDYGDSYEDGYKYLEKIVNIALPLPKIDEATIYKELTKRLKTSFDNNNISIDIYIPDNERHFNSGTLRFFDEIKSIENYITTPRNLIRLTNNFSSSLSILKGEVNYADLLWLELLKLKYFKVYNYIKNNPSVFIELNPLFTGINGMIKDYGEELNKLIKEQYNDNEKSEIKDIVKKLFPKIRKKGEQSINWGNTLSTDELKNRDDASSIERRITDKESLEVFFSYNTVGKISNLKLDDFIKLVNEESLEDSISEIKKIAKLSDKFKLRYHLLLRLQKSQKKTPLFLVLLKSKELLNNDIEPSEDSFYANTYKEEFTHNIFLGIYTEKIDDNLRSEIISCLESNYTLSEIMFAIRGYSSQGREGDKNLIIEMESLALKKVKNSDKPFYLKLDKMSSGQIFSIWVNKDIKDFEKKVLKDINKENLTNFMKIFTDGNDDFSSLGYRQLKFFGLNHLLYEIITSHYPKIKTIEDNERKVPKELKGINNIEIFLRFNYFYKQDVDNKTTPI